MEQETADNATAANATYNVTEGSASNLLPSFVISEPTLVILSILYGLLTLTAVFGNLLVIFVILLNKRMRTRTNAFIVNLACADVITGMWVIPFQFPPAVLYYWPFAVFMCPTMPFIREICSLVSIYTLVVISIDRYLAICHPLHYKMPNYVAVAVLVAVNLHAVMTSWPWLVMLKTFQRPLDGKLVCFVDMSFLGKTHETILPDYYTYLFVIEYLIPLTVLLVTYTLIAHRIWMTKTPGDNIPKQESAVVKNKRKVLKMVFVVVIMFMICWLPLQLYQIITIYDFSLFSLEYINIVWFCSNSLAMANSSCNPIIYGMMNENFKREFKRIFNCRLTSRIQVGPGGGQLDRLDEIQNGDRHRAGTISGTVFERNQREHPTNSTVATAIIK